MAFKILVPGLSPKYMVQCGVCGCKFSCEQQDTMRSTLVKDGKHRGVYCPTCDSLITFNIIDARIEERFEDMKQWKEKLDDSLPS